VIHQCPWGRKSKRVMLDFGQTDRGIKGMKAFFESHKCTDACKFLGLSEFKADDMKWSFLKCKTNMEKLSKSTHLITCHLSGPSPWVCPSTDHHNLELSISLPVIWKHESIYLTKKNNTYLPRCSAASTHSVVATAVVLNDGVQPKRATKASGATSSASMPSKQKAAKSSPRSIAAAVTLVELNGGDRLVTKAAGATGGNKLSHEEKREDAAAAAGEILTAIEEDNEMEILGSYQWDVSIFTIEKIYTWGVWSRGICHWSNEGSTWWRGSSGDHSFFIFLQWWKWIIWLWGFIIFWYWNKWVQLIWWKWGRFQQKAFH
jgi:hypothetical protein